VHNNNNNNKNKNKNNYQESFDLSYESSSSAQKQNTLSMKEPAGGAHRLSQSLWDSIRKEMEVIRNIVNDRALLRMMPRRPIVTQSKCV